MASVHTAIFVVVGVLTLTCGVILTRLAYRAAHRTHWHTLRVVALGFALLTLGLFIDSVEFVLALGHGVRLLQGLLTLGGFATLLYAIYATSEPTTTASS